MQNTQRLTWLELPAHIQAWVEAQLGGRVLSAVSQTGGFSLGTADRLTAENGARGFLKAVSKQVQQRTVQIHASEAAVLTLLSQDLPVAHLLDVFEDDQWIALLLEDIAGAHLGSPASIDELKRVFLAFDTISGFKVPRTATLETLEESITAELALWSKLAEQARERELVDEKYEHIADLELRQQLLKQLPFAREHAVRFSRFVDEHLLTRLAGSCLVHTDVRADNILMGAEKTTIVDWAWACLGNSALDPALVLFDALVGGSEVSVDEARACSALLRGESREFTLAVIVSMTGYNLYAAQLPASSETSASLPLVRSRAAAAGLQILARDKFTQ